MTILIGGRTPSYGSVMIISRYQVKIGMVQFHSAIYHGDYDIRRNGDLVPGFRNFEIIAVIAQTRDLPRVSQFINPGAIGVDSESAIIG